MSKTGERELEQRFAEEVVEVVSTKDRVLVIVRQLVRVWDFACSDQRHLFDERRAHRWCPRIEWNGRSCLHA